VADAKGKGIVFGTGHETGAFGDLVDEWMRAVGGRRIAFESFALEALREGNRLAFGTAAVPHYDFAAAKYIVSFGADFMETWLSPVEFQNAFTPAQAANGAEIVAAVNILNYVAGAVGRTVQFGPDLTQDAAGSYRQLAALRGDMAAGKVAVLLVHGANPAHADAAFAQALGKVLFKVSFSSD